MKKEKLLENSLRLLVFVIGIFSICILLLTVKIKVNAATTSQLSGDLPYYVPLGLEVNNYATSEILDYAVYNYEWYMSNYEPSVTVNSYLVFTTDGYYNDSIYSFVFITNPSIIDTYNDSTNYYDNLIRVNSNGTDVHTLVMGANGDFWGMSNNGSFADLLGNSSTISTSVGTFTPRFPFLLVGTDEILSANDVVIFSNNLLSTPDVFETGHAVEPNYDSDSIIDSGLRPNLVPTAPTYTTYNITTYQAPTIDTSSVENLLKSIWDVISYTGQYIISNIGGFFNNIWNNISLAFGYIGDLLSYLFNKVLNTIKQSVHNLFENFRDLFEPVLNSFANMINIFNTLYNLGLKDGSFDFPTLFGALFVPNQSDLALLVDTFVEFDYLQSASISIKSLINGVFDVLNDDAVYSIHLQGFTFHGVTVPQQEISFDWYLPYKATGDIFISAFLIVGYLYWLWTRISGIFHGAVPDSQGSSEITVDHSVSGVGGWFDY